MFISIRSEVKFRPESFGGLVFIPSRSMVVELNEIGYRILNMITSGIKETQLLSQFSEEQQIYVHQFINDMAYASILQIDEKIKIFNKFVIPHRKANRIPIPVKEESLNIKGKYHSRYFSAPVFVWWDITKTCNLYCKQCYSSSGKTVFCELTTKEVFSIIEQLRSAKVFYIYFLGGEPLMRPDFFEILYKCRECGITTMMSTNGWFINRNVATKLLNSGIQIIRVSIDGATAEVHDHIRGVKGSFKRALNAVAILREVGIPNIGVSPTLLVDNYFQVGKIIDLAVKYGADEVQVVQLCATGRGKGLSSLNLEQFKKARQLVQEAKARYSHKHITATEGILRKQCEICVSMRSAVPGFIGCAGGRSCLAIDEEGRVFPCILYRKVAGTLCTNTLVDIWECSPLFLSMREIKKECRGCAYSNVCGQECPLVKKRLERSKREEFIRKSQDSPISRDGCSKFASSNLCFIRF